MAKFQPGQSGNPGGRPKGLMTKVQAVVGTDGQKLVDRMVLIALGTVSEHEKAGLGSVSVKDRITALEWLADRGFGKAAQSLEVSGVDGGPIETRRVEFVVVGPDGKKFVDA
jgi:hypothetical protein